MVQKTLYLIFLDLQKAYDNVGWAPILEILKEYGVSLNMLGLLKFYWDNQCCVAKSRNYYRETFVPYCDETQGGIVSPTLFNDLMDGVVQKWYEDVMENITTANTRLRGNNVGCLASLFYADDSAIGSLDHKWLQNANQHLCNLFRDYVGLKPNTKKTETISRHPG